MDNPSEVSENPDISDVLSIVIMLNPESDGLAVIQEMFHMYTMSSFLSFFIENKGKSIDKTTIDEVELFASVMRKKVPRTELKEYYESLENQKEKKAAKLRFNIANLERKNKKRRNSINVLNKKAREGQLSAEQAKALEHNEINLIEGEEKLVKLNEQLSYLLSEL